MSAVDAPPGIAFGGRAAGEFDTRPKARRLAWRTLVYVACTGALAAAMAARHSYRAGACLLVVGPLTCLSVAAVGVAVRSARLRIDTAGVAWGWGALRAHMSRGRLLRAEVYRDGVAIIPRRGSTWFLSRRDWERFGDIAGALERAKLPVTVSERRAPASARIQGYSLVLDLLLWASAAATTAALLLALAM